MLTLFRTAISLLEFFASLPVRLARFALYAVMLNPRLGPMRYVVSALAGYLIFALLLVYVIAPIRGYAGAYWQGDKLTYDAERWMATAMYDKTGRFVGTFDAALDSKHDVNYLGVPIETADGYIANPDHKSIPVKEVPDFYWRCLVYHEDRNLGSAINPFGIDLVGVLKIPYSSLKRTLTSFKPTLGVGGSTLPMQLARVIYQTPPRSDESAFEKLGRKLGEWWDAPVIYWALTKGGNQEPLKQWAANHLWLAQRTGGEPLHGIETTARIVFGKPADKLSIAEQFILASAVNKPIILLQGSERLNAVRQDRWSYIVEVRAQKCASELIKDETEKKKIWFELTQIAGGPPDPQVDAELANALAEFTPDHAKVAEANPVLRANVLAPEVRYGTREEMKNEYGFNWRQEVRGVDLTLDVIANRRFRDKVKALLPELQKKYQPFIDQGYSLDPAATATDAEIKVPNVIIAAANQKGEIVRYYETLDTAAYFGSPFARDSGSGHYEPDQESRAIASTGKMIAAIAIANEGHDTPESLYADDQAPSASLESCNKGTSQGLRRARIAFACSLNRPIEWKMARVGQATIKKLVDALGFRMPKSNGKDDQTPPSTAVVRGLIMGSPRTVQHMAAVILAALLGHGDKPVPEPTLVASYDKPAIQKDQPESELRTNDIIPNDLIKASARPLIETFLSAPLCTEVHGERVGTLKSISDWCASRHAGVKIHIAKTGTMVTEDPDATVDAWAVGGIAFDAGPAYSYVVVVGTGNAREPWARKVHAAQVAAPLVDLLLQDLAADAKSEKVAVNAPVKPATN